MPHWSIASFAVPLLLMAQSASAGPITGNYWYLGVGNDQAVEEGQGFFDILKEFQPWKDLPAERMRIRRNAGGMQILADLKFFHDNVKNGDTFVFYYGGHSSRINDENGDETDGRDEVIGLFGEAPDFASDDELAGPDAFGSFPTSSTSIVIFKTCLSGGFIDGTSDLARKDIADKKNLLFMGATGPDELCGPQHRAFFSDLFRGLEEGQKDDKQTHAMEWRSTMAGFWRERGFDLATSGELDDRHDRTVAKAISEPGAICLVGIGLLGVFGCRRWRM